MSIIRCIYYKYVFAYNYLCILSSGVKCAAPKNPLIKTGVKCAKWCKILRRCTFYADFLKFFMQPSCFLRNHFRCIFEYPHFFAKLFKEKMKNGHFKNVQKNFSEVNFFLKMKGPFGTFLLWNIPPF